MLLVLYVLFTDGEQSLDLFWDKEGLEDNRAEKKLCIMMQVALICPLSTIISAEMIFQVPRAAEVSSGGHFY